MLAKNSTNSEVPVDKKVRRFFHELECTSMNTHSDSISEATQLGRTLREIRLNRKWSLKDFEIASGSKIKDVVLGSYERGTRSISVSKLSIIAKTYEIPMSAFFPESKFKNTPANDEQIIIDLRKLRDVLKNYPSEPVQILNKFTNGIVNMRKDWNGEVLSLRSTDLRLISLLQADAPHNGVEEYKKLNLLLSTRD